MNVGPCGRGYMDARATNALDAYGKWMKYNGRSIYGCTKAEPEFTAPAGTLLTQSEDGKRLYIHLLSYPFSILSMQGLSDRIAYAQFLHDASELRYTVGRPGNHFGDGLSADEKTVYFSLPVIAPPTEVPVIEIYLR